MFPNNLHVQILVWIFFLVGPVSHALAQDELPAGVLRRMEGAKHYVQSPLSPTALAPDGKTLFRSRMGKLEIVDVLDGKTLSVFPPSANAATISSFQAAYSPDGKKILVGGLNASTVWNVEKATAEHVVKHGFVSAGRESNTAWSADSQWFAICSLEQMNLQGPSIVEIWDADTGRSVKSLRATPSASRVTFSNDRKWLATWGPSPLRLTDKTPLPIVLWEIETGKTVQSLDPPNGEKWLACCFLPEKDRLAAIDSMGRILTFDVATGKQESVFAEGNSRRDTRAQAKSTHLRVSPDGKHLVHVDWAGTIRLWDRSKKAKIVERQAKQVVDLAFVSGKTLALTMTGQAYNVLDVMANQYLIADRGHQAGIGALAFSADGKELISASGDAQLLWWNPADGTELRRKKAGTYEIGLSLTPIPARLQTSYPLLSDDGQYWALAEPFTREDQFVHVPTGKMLASSGNLGVLGARWIALSTDGGKFARIDSKSISVTDRRTAITVTQERKNAAPPNFLPPSERAWAAVTRDGKFVAVGETKLNVGSASVSELHLHDFANNERLASLAFPDHFMAPALAFSPDEKSLAVAANKVVLLDVASGAERGLNDRLNGSASALRFAPGGFSFAVATTNRSNALFDPGRLQRSLEVSIEIYETATLKIREKFHGGHQGIIRALAFSPNETMLASAGEDLSIVLWDLGALASEVNAPTLDSDWRDLASADAKKAFQVIRRWSKEAEKATAFLKKRLAPAPKPALDAQQIEKLVDALAEDQFALREKASQELQKLGDLAVPALQGALSESVTLEVKQRIQRILKKIHDTPLANDDLRALRALEILHRLDTPASREIVADLSQGGPAPLTRAAKGILKRWEKQP